MWEDTIVAEVRAIRDKIAAKFNYDIRAIGNDAQKRERENGRKLYSPPRRRRAKKLLGVK